VSARRASAARISADVDKIVVQFAPYGELPDEPAALRVPAGLAGTLADRFAIAAGVVAICESVRDARELRAMDYIGWPVSWIAERLRHRNPARKIRLGQLWQELRNSTTGPSGAQQAEIDLALTGLADDVTPGLPQPWSRTVRTAIRSRAEEIPATLGAQIAAALPAERSAERWWRVAGVGQGLLLGCGVVGLAWFGTLLALGVFDTGSGLPRLFSSALLLPAAALLVAVSLCGGWLLARRCEVAVKVAAARESELLEAEIRTRMASVAQDLVLAPADLELAELERYRAELEVARGHGRAEARMAAFPV
jgi:hypothetical protein